MNRIDGESHFENDVPNWIRCGEAKVVDLWISMIGNFHKFINSHFITFRPSSTPMIRRWIREKHLHFYRILIHWQGRRLNDAHERSTWRSTWRFIWRFSWWWRKTNSWVYRFHGGSFYEFDGSDSAVIGTSSRSCSGLNGHWNDFRVSSGRLINDDEWRFQWLMSSCRKQIGRMMGAVKRR